MPLQRAKHPEPEKIRSRLLATSLKALAQLRIEREVIEASGEGLPKCWCERFKIIADQVRRDLPDQAEASQTLPMPAKPTLAGLRIVG